MPRRASRMCAVGVGLLALVELGAGCVGVEHSPTTLADSAGVRIVTYDLTEAPLSAFGIERRAFLRLGEPREDEAYEFESSHSWLNATRLSNGSIVVNDRESLKFFSPRGELIRRVGRAGDGPGEFRSTREVCRLEGDSLLVIEYLNGRTSVWEGTGRHVRTFPRLGFIPLQGCGRDGRVVVRGDVHLTRSSEGDVPSADYQLMGLDGSAPTRLGRFASTHYAGPYAFEPAVIPVGNRLLVADPRAGELRVHARGGAPTVILRVGVPREPISDDEWRTRVNAMIPRIATEAQRATMTQRYESQRPRYRPAFGRVLVDDARRVWIADAERPRSWSVFSLRGSLIGRVEIPEGTLVRAGRDEVVLLVRDSDGMALLAFHRIRGIRDPQSEEDASDDR